MPIEEDVTRAKSLLEEWRSGLARTFEGNEGSPVRAQLENALSSAQASVDKVQQAVTLRRQIDGMPDGMIKDRMGGALREIERELGFELPKQQSLEAQAPAEESWELKVVVQSTGGTASLIMKDLHPGTTVGVLKAMVEERSGVPSASQVIYSSPSSKQPLSVDDSAALSTLGVRNRDTLVIGVSGAAGGGGGAAPSRPTGETARSVEARVRKAGVKVKGPKDALALAVHVVMLDSGFTAVAADADPNGPRGFAPPVRPVPESRLVPADWNADPSSVRLSYRHDKLRGKEIEVKVLWLDESVVVEMTNGPSPTTLALLGSDFVDVSGTGTDPMSFYREIDRLQVLISTQLVAPLLPAPKAAPQGGRIVMPGGATPQPSAPPQHGGPPLGIPVPNPLGPIPVGGVGYGGRIGGLVPDFGGDLQPGGGFGPTGGNLMGPNHPLFTGEGRGGFGGPTGPGGGLGLPQPRFDPYGPVVGPTRGGPFPGGEDPNDPRGRGRAFRGPDPDHLPPPGPGNFYY